jgi:hypothetical protein
MSPFLYETYVIFENGDEMNYFSHDISDCVFMLGKWLNQRVTSWKIVRVCNVNGSQKIILSADMGEVQ